VRDGFGLNAVAVGSLVLALGIFDGVGHQSLSYAQACRYWHADPRQSGRYQAFQDIWTTATGDRWASDPYVVIRPMPRLEAERPPGCQYPPEPEPYVVGGALRFIRNEPRRLPQ
jgi:hypothetical protein